MKNHNTIKLSFLALVFFAITAMNVFASGAPPQFTITSQPSSLNANQNYPLTFNVTDAYNNTVNVTAAFYVGGQNTYNYTWTNNATTPGSNSYSVTFNENLYVEGQTVYTNISAREAGNATSYNSTATNTVTVGRSSTQLIDSDALSGLGNTGGYIGDFMGNVVSGIFKFILLIGLGVAIVGLIVAVIAIVKSKGVGGFKFGR